VWTGLKRYTGVIPIEDVQEIIYVESNDQVADYITGPYDVMRDMACLLMSVHRR